ncbi:MAG: hypothetical protein ACE5FG_07100 [Myxococcota bacterium]
MTGRATLSDAARLILLGVFALTAVGIIELGGSQGLARVPLLVFALSSGALLSSLLWLVLLALRLSRGWAVALLLSLPVPYLGLVLASIFARRHWTQGARTPALLAVASLLGQSIASAGLLVPALPTLV